jgi:hypothetical protein
MGKVNHNLLLSVHKFASGHDEDFTTESFVHLLRVLKERDSECFVHLLGKISDSKIHYDEDELPSLRIRTQISTEEGVPDIEIRTPKSLLYVEVKVGSDFGYHQLERYKRMLVKDSRHPNTCLSVLTRHPVLKLSEHSAHDAEVRWIQIAECLEELDLNDSISRFTVDQFVEFLKGRGMTMETISWELVNGVKAFMGLQTMIGEVLAANGYSTSKSAGQGHYGYYIDNKKYFVGIYYQNPNIISFETSYGFKLGKYDHLEMGQIENGNQWYNELDMQSEEYHFFARSKSSQMKCIEEFLADNLRYAATLEAKDQEE